MTLNVIRDIVYSAASFTLDENTCGIETGH